jgi:hypothetical protein
VCEPKHAFSAGLGDPGQRPELDPRAGGIIDGVVLLESTRQVGLQVLSDPYTRPPGPRSLLTTATGPDGRR